MDDISEKIVSEPVTAASPATEPSDEPSSPASMTTTFSNEELQEDGRSFQEEPVHEVAEKEERNVPSAAADDEKPVTPAATPTRHESAAKEDRSDEQSSHANPETSSPNSASSTHLFRVLDKLANTRRSDFHQEMMQYRARAVDANVSGTPFKERHAAFVIPSFNEKDDVKYTVDSLEGEIGLMVRNVPWITTVSLLFVVDGSDQDQFRTAMCTVVHVLRCMDHLTNLFPDLSSKAEKEEETQQQDSTSAACWPSLVSASEELDQLHQGQVEIQQLQFLLDESKDTDLKAREHYQERMQALKQAKATVFRRQVADVPYLKCYPSLVLGYESSFALHRERTSEDIEGCTYGSDMQEMMENADGVDPFVLTVHVTVLIKEQNKQKRDSLLLAANMFLRNDEAERPAYMFFVDCDTSWETGSAVRLLEYLHHPSYAHVRGVAGDIQLRNNHFFNPLLQMQDFSYAVSQIGAKEAENFTGMVTCMPGAFSLVRLEAATQINILDRMTRYPRTLAEKNRLDLGEDRYWTTLILENINLTTDREEDSPPVVTQTSANVAEAQPLRHRKPQSVQNSQSPGTSTSSAFSSGAANHNSAQRNRAEVHYLGSARAKTDAPDDFISYMLQQRRWINSSLVNAATGLVPLLNQEFWRCSVSRQSLGGFYLWSRCLLDMFAFSITPAVATFFIFTMLLDVGATRDLASILVFVILFLTLLLVLVFDKPRELTFPYRVYMWISCAFFEVLFVWWSIAVMVAGPQDKTPMRVLRYAMVFSFFACFVSLAAAHCRLRDVLAPPWKPLCYLAFLPITFLLLPLYTIRNLDDFSWGNRDSRAAASQSEVRDAGLLCKKMFFGYVLWNISVVFLSMNLPTASLDVLFLLLFCVLLMTTGFTFVLSMCSAVSKCCARPRATGSSKLPNKSHGGRDRHDAVPV